MFRHLTMVFSLGTFILLTNSIVQAQYGGASVQTGGYGYGNPNHRNFGYGNPNYSNYGYNYAPYQSYYPTYGYNNNGHYNNNNGYYNNRYYNNNRNGGYIYSSPNYYVAPQRPQRAYSVQRFRRW